MSGVIMDNTNLFINSISANTTSVPAVNSIIDNTIVSCLDASSNEKIEEQISFDYAVTTSTGVNLTDALKEIEEKMLNYVADSFSDCNMRRRRAATPNNRQRYKSRRLEESRIVDFSMQALDSKPIDIVDDDLNHSCHGTSENSVCTPIKGYMTARICSSCYFPEMHILQTIRDGALNDEFISVDNHTVLDVLFIGIRTEDDASSQRIDLIPHVADKLQQVYKKSTENVTPLGSAFLVGLCFTSAALGIGFRRRRMRTKSNIKSQGEDWNDSSEEAGNDQVLQDKYARNDSAGVSYPSDIPSEMGSQASQYGMEVTLY